MAERRAALVSIQRRNGTEVLKVRVPPQGKPASAILETLRDARVAGYLEVEGVALTADDIILPEDSVTLVPPAVVDSAPSAIAFVDSPVRPSKKLRASIFQGKARRVGLDQLVGVQSVDAVAALNWLWLHLFGASVDLTTFLSTTHEKRYYPYVLALLRAAAVSDRSLVEVLGEDKKNKSAVPDVQFVIEGKDVIPADVKQSWACGSVDDPDGVIRSADDLSQLLKYVLEYNKQRSGSFSCLTTLIIRVQHVFFLNFHIRRDSPDHPGTLDMLEYAPGFSRGGGRLVAEAGLLDVKLINIGAAMNAKFGLDRTWSEESVQSLALTDRLLMEIQATPLQKLLPAYAPKGFHSLVKYFRTVAPDCYGQVEFRYQSQDGVAEVSHLLASGPKSCVFASANMSSVFKVSCESYIQREACVHSWADSSDSPYLRKMKGEGVVVGAAPGLRFIELEGVGFPFAKKHVETEERLGASWRHASEAVRALHASKVFHRDIKPSNLMVMDEGLASQRMVLGDLDCAGHWNESMVADVGTEMFRSPLLRAGDEYRCRDDWLSLGLSFAYLLGLFPADAILPAMNRRDIVERVANSSMVSQDMREKLIRALTAQNVCCTREFSCAYI